MSPQVATPSLYVRPVFFIKKFIKSSGGFASKPVDTNPSSHGIETRMVNFKDSSLI